MLTDQFLAVDRKFKYNCLYIFHIIYSKKSTRKVILSQAKIYNIFHDTPEKTNVLQILLISCSRESNTYIPKNNLWLNRIFLNLAYGNKNDCLTVGCCRINPNGLWKYKTNVGNALDQLCYFKVKSRNKLYCAIASKRVKNSEKVCEQINAKIDKVTGSSKSGGNFDYNAKIELKDLLFFCARRSKLFHVQ